MTGFYVPRPMPADLRALQEAQPLPPGWEATGASRGVKYRHPGCPYGLTGNDPDEALWLAIQLESLARESRDTVQRKHYTDSADILRAFATSHRTRHYQQQYRASTLVA